MPNSLNNFGANLAFLRRLQMKNFLLLILLTSIFFQTSLFAQKNEPIRIGVFVDLSGPTSSFGLFTTNGIKLAVKEINNSGGINGRKLKIFIEDDQARPEMAKEVVRKLIFETKVEAIIGEVASTNSLAAAPDAQSAKIPMISPASTNLKVTEVGDYIFRTAFIDPLQGEAMAKFAFNELKARRVAILSYLYSDYSKGLEQTFEETFTKLGGKVVHKQNYDSYTKIDFKPQLTKIRKTKPDALYLPGYYAQVGMIAKQARQLKMTMPILGGDGWDSPELWKPGGEALNNTYITNHFAEDDSLPKVRDFVARYKTEFGTVPDSLAALGYDTLYLLADALRRAESTDSDDLRRAISETKDFSGVTGRISRFSLARNPIKPVIILKLNTKTSRFVYQTTIEP